MNVRVMLNGRGIEAAAGSSVAAALMNEGVTRFRTSVAGAPRAPLCGMGSCFECRVRIDGAPHQRACLITVRDGMAIDTDD